MRVRHPIPQECEACAYNDALHVKNARSIRFDAAPDAAVRATLERSVAAAAGRIVWQDDAATGRAYALVETPEPFEPAVGTAYAGAIIALAVTPRPSEACPPLLESLGGDGRPSGMLTCERLGDEVVLEWDPGRTRASLVMALIDAELARFRGTRVARALAPMPDAVLAAVAADGMDAPEIAPDRFLETYIEGRDGLA